MKDKVAFITGGSLGIGRATALELARQGAKVAITGRNQPEGDAAVADIEAAGGEALFVKSDVSFEEDIERAVAETVARFGRLDVAFNNAGIGEIAGPLADMEAETFDSMFGVNVRGVWLSMKHEIRQMLKQGDGGSIVNCSSIQAHVAIAGSGHYTATKHAIEGYTKVGALDYAGDGIRINAVAPGVIADGRLGAGEAPQEFQDFLLAKHPLGRFGKGKDVAGAVAFLMSDAADFITGTVLFVDGGYMVE
ncbi:MAG: SDR family NAD(P)-dependent oxidoreductase [Alphaproteobacteria bacterium]